MDTTLELALIEGEGLKVEFKERLSNLDREIVAFANTVGGTIYLGVDDSGKIIGITIDNALKSQIADIAYNCDPSIKITFHEYRHEKVLAVHVPPGMDKPYRSKEGFYVRNGPSTQKLKRDEIVALINQTDKMRFDETLNTHFEYPKDFSEEALTEYLRTCGINTRASSHDILISLNAAEEVQKQLKFTNAGVLFFAKEPQQFFPESYITAVKYKTAERFSILDKKDFKGSPISQIEQALSFIFRHMNVEPTIMKKTGGALGARHDVYEYSPLAIREAVINAVTHRDYLYDSSHIYIHMFPDYIEIENPGGLYRGLTLEDLGKRSIRRNRLLADFLHRAGFIERVGSGFSRMEHSLLDNNNPPLEVVATNFFNIRFYKRLNEIDQSLLTSRQRTIYQIICNTSGIQKRDIATQLQLSEDTILRELHHLIELNLVSKKGTGKATMYLKNG
jgi:ATP-dependent DNA helicase RecG